MQVDPSHKVDYRVIQNRRQQSQPCEVRGTELTIRIGGERSGGAYQDLAKDRTKAQSSGLRETARDQVRGEGPPAASSRLWAANRICPLEANSDCP